MVDKWRAPELCFSISQHKPDLPCMRFFFSPSKINLLLKSYQGEMNIERFANALECAVKGFSLSHGFLTAT